MDPGHAYLRAILRYKCPISVCLFVKLLLFHIRGGHARVGKVLEAWEVQEVTLPGRSSHSLPSPSLPTIFLWYL